MAEIPTYFDCVFEFKIENNGILSSLPYLSMAGLSFVFGWIADWAFKKKWLTIQTSRKFFNTIGNFFKDVNSICKFSLNLLLLFFLC